MSIDYAPAPTTVTKKRWKTEALPSRSSQFNCLPRFLARDFEFCLQASTLHLVTNATTVSGRTLSLNVCAVTHILLLPEPCLSFVLCPPSQLSKPRTWKGSLAHLSLLHPQIPSADLSHFLSRGVLEPTSSSAL